MAPPQPRPPRSWRSRLLRLSFSSAVLLSATVVVLRSETFSEWAVSSLAVFLEGLTGESFVIGDLSIEPLKGRVALDGLVISHPGAPPGEGTIAAVEQIEAQLSMRGGWPRLERVSIRRPSVRLHIDPDGLREFRALTQRSSAGSSDPADAFPWERLDLIDAQLTIDAQNDTRIRAFGVTLTESGGTAELTLGGAALQTPRFSQNIEPTVITGARVSPGRLMIPGLRLRSESFDVAGSLVLAAGGPVRGRIDALVDLPGLSPLMQEGMGLSGSGLVEAELLGTLAEPRLEGAVLVRDGAVLREGRVVSLGEEISAGWQLSGRQLLLDRVVAHWAGGLVEANASIDLGTTGLYAAISGEGLALSEALILAGVVEAPWVDMDGDVELQLAGVLQPMSLAGSVSLAGADFEVAGGSIATPGRERLLVLPRLSVDGSLQLRRDSMTFQARTARLGESRAVLRADMTYGADASLALTGDFSTLELEDVRPLAGLGLTGRGPASVSVSGPLDGLSVDAQVELAGFGFAGLVFADGVSGAVRSPDLRQLILPDLQARLGESLYSGQLVLDLDRDVPEIDLQILLSEGRLPDLIGVTVDLEGVDGAVDGVMSLQGPTDALDGEIRLSARDVDLYGEHFDDGDVVAWMEGGRFTLERLELRRPRGERTESLFARGSVGKGYATNVEVISSGLRLDSMDLLADYPQLHGELSLDARLSGTLQSLAPSGRLALRRTRIGLRTVDPSTIDFETADGLLSFEGVVAEDAEAGSGMEVAGSLDLWDHQRYKVSAEMSDFPVSAFYSHAPDGSPITAAVTGALRLEGDLPGATPRVLEAEVSSAELTWGAHELHSIQSEPWTFSLTGDRFSLEGLSLVDRRGASRVRFGGAGQAGGEMFLAGDGVVDLDLLRMVVPGLQRGEGLASLNVSVIRARPGLPAQAAVDVDIEDALVQGTWFPHPVESMAVDITATPDGYTLRGGRGRIGGGRLGFSGRIDAEQWVPTRYDVRGTLADARVRYLDFLPPMTGDADITISGPQSSLLLSGSVNVDSMVFSERIDWESWVLEVSGERLRDAVAEETSDLFAMDVKIRADDTIRMRNNVADLTAGGALHLSGTTGRPGMTGTIRAQPGGFVYLKERNFELQRAELSFIDPYSFDPDVEIAMVTQVSSREQDVDIEYRVRGQYSDWYAETSSDPPLSPADINALLLFGLTLEELERYGGLSSALVVEGGDLLASKFGIVEQVGEGIFQYELLKLDRIDLISGVSERSYSAVTSELRLLAEKDLEWGATLRLEQNLNRVSDTYISLEQKLARKLYLRGYYATEQQDRYLTIGGAYGVDVNVRWELD